MDETLTIRPQSLRRIAGRASRIVWNADERFTASASSHADAENSSTGAARLDIPLQPGDLVRRLQAVEHDVATGCRQTFGNGQTETLRRTGDQRGLTGQHNLGPWKRDSSHNSGRIPPRCVAQRSFMPN